MREPDKTRYLNALNLIEQAEVPFVEIDADFTVYERVLGRPVPGIRKAYELPPRDYLEYIQRLGLDMAYLAVPWKLGRREQVDAEGRSLYADGTIKTRADLKRIRDPGDDAIRRRLDEMTDALEGTNIGLFYNHWNTPVVATTAIGYEDYYRYLLTDPEFVHECFKRVDEVISRQLELILQYPIDAHLVVAILAMSSGPLMSDDLLEEFEFPYLERNVRRIRAAGAPVSFHCDGNNGKFFPRLIKMGIQGLQAIDPCGGRQDVYELKRRYGDRLALHGSIDSWLLINGTADEVSAEVARQIEVLGVGGGYICSSSHDLNEQMPMENIWAMVHTVHNTRGRTSGACPDA